MNERFILGSKVHDLSMEQAVQIAATFLTSNKPHAITTPNPEICLAAYSNKNLREAIKNADLNIPDGFGLRIGAQILGQKLHNTVHGVDFVEKLFELCDQMHLRVLLIGGRGISGTRAIGNLKARYSHLQVEYFNGGKFSNEGVSEFPDFVSRITQ